MVLEGNFDVQLRQALGNEEMTEGIWKLHFLQLCGKLKNWRHHGKTCRPWKLSPSLSEKATARQGKLVERETCMSNSCPCETEGKALTTGLGNARLFRYSGRDKGRLEQRTVKTISK